MRHSFRSVSLKAGFTLVELLVVVGIVSVLIAMLLPVLGRVREHANRVKCAANLRSIGQALTMYTQQYGFYPGLEVWVDRATPQRAIWPTRLRAFLNGEQRAFNCPSQDSGVWWVKGSPFASPPATDVDTRFGYELGEPVLITWSTPFSYGYNWMGTKESAWVVDGSDKGLGKMVDALGRRLGEYGEVRANRVRVPSNMIAIADSTADGRADFAIHPSSERSLMHPGKIHSGGANVLFCDGHVQWHLQKDLVFRPNIYVSGNEGPMTQDRGLLARMWNNDHEWNP